MVERQTRSKIKVLHIDKGGEFTSQEFNSFCERHGIIKQLTTPYTPQQNGVSERKNRTIMEMARALLKDKGMPLKFWAEVVLTAVQLINISFTIALKNKTPYEVWLGYKPKVSHLWVFRCIAYSLLPSNKLQKLDTKSKKCVFIGYCLDSEAYQLFNPVTSKVIMSSDVTFNEDAG